MNLELSKFLLENNDKIEKEILSWKKCYWKHYNSAEFVENTNIYYPYIEGYFIKHIYKEFNGYKQCIPSDRSVMHCQSFSEAKRDCKYEVKSLNINSVVHYSFTLKKYPPWINIYEKNIPLFYSNNKLQIVFLKVSQDNTNTMYLISTSTANFYKENKTMQEFTEIKNKFLL